MGVTAAAHGRTRQVAAALAVVTVLHMALLTLWPGRATHASSARGASAITLVAVDAPRVAADAAVPVQDAPAEPVPVSGHVAQQPARKTRGNPPPALSAPAVDMAAQPRSAPDIATLQGLPFSGLPMRIRLTIDSAGRVVDVVMLRSMDDAAVNEAVRRMFLATGFVPARRAGVDVASVQDIDISLDDLR